MKKFYAFAAATLFAVAANAQNLYICGSGDGLEWAAANPAEMPMVNGHYEMDVTNLTQFKLSKVCEPESGNNGWDGFNSGVIGCDYGKVPGVAVELVDGYEANISAPWKGDYKIVVSGDLATITLTTDTPQPAASLPELYFRGDMNGWGADDAWKLEALSETIFKFVCSEEQQIAPGDGFKIADADWNEYNIGGGDDAVIVLDTEWEVFQGSNPANMGVEETFNGIAWLNLDIDGQAYIYLSNDKNFVPDWEGLDVNAVEGIQVAQDAPVYYNLQGVRVANPANGIYVKVVGGKATKAVIK